jgi:hypothetical protein
MKQVTIWLGTSAAFLLLFYLFNNVLLNNPITKDTDAIPIGVYIIVLVVTGLAVIGTGVGRERDRD